MNMQFNNPELDGNTDYYIFVRAFSSLDTVSQVENLAGEKSQKIMCSNYFNVALFFLFCFFQSIAGNSAFSSVISKLYTVNVNQKLET